MELAGVWQEYGPRVASQAASLLWTIGAIAVVSGVAWLASRRVGRPLATLLHRLTGRPMLDSGELRALVRDVIAALLMLLASALLPPGPLARTILGAVLGLATAYVVRRALMLAGTRPRWATAAALLIFVVVIAGMLGGLAQLTAALDSVGVTIGKRRVTPLSVIVTVAVIVLLYFGARLLSRIVAHSLNQTALDPSQRVLAQKLAGIAIVVAAFFMGIDILAIDLTALTVFSGAVGLAVGFGLQKTFGNLIAGVILLMDRSIKPGDVIVVGHTFGSVSKIGVRAVSVVTRDGKEHLIPNENLMTQEVENWSYSSRDVRIHIPVGIGYGCNIKVAQRLMAEAATASARVLADPKPAVWLTGFGDNSVDHDILVWITDPEAGVGNVQSEILNRLWDLFAENGIEIPFPQRDIHIRSLPPKP